MKRTLRFLRRAPALLAGLSAAFACRDQAVTAPTPPQCGKVVLALAPATLVLAVGDTGRLVASYADTSGVCGPVPPLASFRFASSDSTVVSVDSVSGLVRALQHGSALLSVHGSGSTIELAESFARAWIPLYGRIVFSRLMMPRPYPPSTCPPGQGGCPPSLWTMKPDGSDQQLLLDSLNWPEHPQISPDGRTVAFENWGDVYLVDASGLNKRKVSGGLAKGESYTPSWSSTGQLLVFEGVALGDSVWQVFSIHADGTGLRKLTSFPYPYGASSPTWSPDGTRIAFVGYTGSSDSLTFQPYVMDSGGANIHRLLSVPLPNFRGEEPAWSPDGSTILFLDGESGIWAIWRLRFADSSYMELADAQGNRPGEWSPDGKYIVYGTGDLWVMNADGTNQHDLFGDGFLNMEASWGPAAPTPTSLRPTPSPLHRSPQRP